MVKKISFIGLGRMGGAIAANLLKDGFEVVGFDLDQILFVYLDYFD